MSNDSAVHQSNTKRKFDLQKGQSREALEVHEEGVRFDLRHKSSRLQFTVRIHEARGGLQPLREGRESLDLQAGRTEPRPRNFSVQGETAKAEEFFCLV